MTRRSGSDGFESGGFVSDGVGGVDVEMPGVADIIFPGDITVVTVVIVVGTGIEGAVVIIVLYRSAFASHQDAVIDDTGSGTRSLIVPTLSIATYSRPCLTSSHPVGGCRWIVSPQFWLEQVPRFPQLSG